MNKILIVEDEKRVAELLQTGLEEAGYCSAVAYDGELGLRLFQYQSYDLVISDIILPKRNGFELCQEIRRINDKVPILMLTALGSADDKLDGFDSGADDYMVKPFDFRELIARIKALLKRVDYHPQAVSSKILEYGDLSVDLDLMEVKRQGQVIKLSPKEYSLLLYMVEHADRVISRTEIAKQVWRKDFDTGTNFIDVYINYLRKKLDNNFSVKLIHTKPGIGFVFTNKQ